MKVKSKIFVIYDCKAEAYLQPFVMPSRGQAVRAFDSTCNDESSQFNKYPSDFTLFEIGEFDESDGSISPYKAKVALGVALEFKKVSPLSPPAIFNALKERSA